MMRMRRLWGEFKAIAINGSVLDLALGFIIGAAFATLIESFVEHIFMQLIAAIAGQPDFGGIGVNIGKTKIEYGAFLTDVLNFMLLAVALFVVVKLMLALGVERGRPLELRQCPYCLDRVPASALICRSCGQQLVEELPPLGEAEKMLADRQARKWPALARRGAPGSGSSGSGSGGGGTSGSGSGGGGTSGAGGSGGATAPGAVTTPETEAGAAMGAAATTILPEQR